jgi:hypothetical protein
MKKITIVGRGTVGCIAIAHFLRWTNWEIDWVFDPNIETTSVGEGTTLALPTSLRNNLNFDSIDMDNVFSTPKLGIWKRNWGNGTEFHHTFPVGLSGIHFNAVVLQNYIFDKVSKNRRVRVIESNEKNYEELDSDFVMVCTGTPKQLNEETFKIHTNIPVNSCVVMQCPWELPKFLYSITFAKKFGWMFGIPIRNRCAIGYLYNDEFSKQEDLIEEFDEIFSEFGITPNTNRNIKFNNYSRKINFSDKVVYNGNSSFFLEPLEATSTGFADLIVKLSYDLWIGKRNVNECNLIYNSELDDIESMICLHYYSGSIFKNDFWKFAQKLGEEKIRQAMSNKTGFYNAVKVSINNPSEFFEHNFDAGSWSLRSYRQNIKFLNLENKFKEMLNCNSV